VKQLSVKKKKKEVIDNAQYETTSASPENDFKREKLNFKRR
jgi:hypothetical protein